MRQPAAALGHGAAGKKRRRAVALPDAGAWLARADFSGGAFFITALARRGEGAGFAAGGVCAAPPTYPLLPKNNANFCKDLFPNRQMMVTEAINH